jgi:hypothetical protein
VPLVQPNKITVKLKLATSIKRWDFIINLLIWILFGIKYKAEQCLGLMAQKKTLYQSARWSIVIQNGDDSSSV